MITRIVVPLDGSVEAESVLPAVLALSVAVSVPVVLVQVSYGYRNSEDFPGEWSETPEIFQEMELRTDSYLHEIAERLKAQGVSDVSAEPLLGESAEQIIEMAEEDDGTLVTMATHGSGGIVRWTDGSVTDRVVRHSHGQTLVVRTTPGGDDSPTSTQFTRVLVPLDGSKLAEDALESAGSLAKALNVPVTLLEVGDRLQIFNEMWPQDPNIAARLQDQTAAYLESKAEELSAKGVEVIVLEFGPGDPAGVVVDMVDEVPGTLVVMTTHGRGGLKRWTLGSVADRVIRHSNGATLVIYSAEK